MTEMSFQKPLFKAIKELKEELEELKKYGTPHLIGEIKKNNDEWAVYLTLPVIESEIEEFSIEENKTLMFLCPIGIPGHIKYYGCHISHIQQKATAGN